MGCHHSTAGVNPDVLLDEIRKEIESPKYGNLTQVCPECYLKGILYKNIEDNMLAQNLIICNCGCGLNLCNFHYNRHNCIKGHMHKKSPYI